jgi:pantoate--beta-alanine ligase
MSPSIKSGLVHTPGELRKIIAAWRAKGERIALVPTMGALHAGHMALVSEAKRQADRVVVSVFVNPTQFAPTEDFSAYPRTLEADRRRVDEAGGDLVYAPDGAAMYPAGFATTVSLEGPAAADLEDRFRPTHFAGVATVVTKLLIQALPDIALFGEKDFQQLCVIKRFARDLDLPVEILGVPIVRDADGLALSSRNVYLSPGERATAPALHAALRRAAATIRQGGAIEPALDAARADVTHAGFVIDYIEARHSESLAPLASGSTAGRILAAARLGRTRLIDNVGIEDEG